MEATHQKLQHLLAHSPAVMYALKLEGHSVTPNLVSENINLLLGFTVEESLRPGWWLEHLHPEDRDRVLAAFSNAVAHGTGTTEYRIRHKDGSYRWVEDKNRVVSDASGGPGEIVGVWTDITERKRAAQRLATHHAASQALADSATLAEASKKILQVVCQYLQWDVGLLWTVDGTARALRCVEVWHQPSEEFKEFATRSRETVFPAGEGWVGRVWEAGRPEWIADVAAEPNLPRKRLANQMGLLSAIAVPMKLRQKTLGVIEFFSAQIHPPDDELLAMFATLGSQIGQFVARKQLEDQLRQSQKMEAFGQLAGGVAHDFNNILAVILGYTSLLMKDESLKDGARAQLKQVYSAGERAAGLTRQMLTFSRKKQMQVTPIDLNGVIGNMTKMLGRIIGEDINLQYNYSSRPPVVQADEGMIEQVLMNLVVNARDAMPKGGQLTIGTEAMAVDAARAERHPDARAGDFVCLSVRDTGCGITPEDMTRIFEPFFTTKDVGKGTGLGLATVYGIVKQHQGWIEVESQGGAGTNFKVFLPDSSRAAAPEQTALDPTVRGGNETILLVEDDVAVRGLARVVLQRHGYRVVEADSGNEALSVWEDHGSPIDLLLTDMIMPDGMTCWDLAKQLLTRNPDLKVIYTSGYSAESEGPPSELRQAPTFLQKPYHPQKLARAVRECLDLAAVKSMNATTDEHG